MPIVHDRSGSSAHSSTVDSARASLAWRDPPRHT